MSATLPSLVKCYQTRNTFCRTRSLSNPMYLFFIFDHVTVIQFKICCCVQNFIKIRWFFTDIWRYIDCQNGGRPPSWNCFTIIQDRPRSRCCWPQLPLKFHVNLMHRSEDIAIWIFSHIWLGMPIQAPKWRFWGLWTPKYDYLLSRFPKGTSLHKSASFKLSTVKIRWGVWPVGELTESVTDTQTDRQTHTQVNLYSVHA